MKSFNSLLLSFILCLATGFSAQAHAKPKVIDQIVATVNGHPILLSELKKVETTTANELRAQGKEDAIDQPTTFSQKVLAQMIEDYLLDQEIARLGMQAGDAQLEQVLQSIMAENRIASKEEFRKALESQGYQFDEFVENYRKRISRNNYVRQNISPNIEVSDQDIQNRLQKPNADDRLMYSLTLLFVPHSDHPNLDTTGKEFLAFAEKLKKSDDLSLAQNRFKVAAPISMKDVSEKDLQKPIRDALKQTQIGEVSDPIEMPNGFAWVKKEKEVRGTAPISEQDRARVSELILNEEIAKSLNQAITALKDKATIKTFYP